MFNFLKKESREFNLPEQVLPYKLEELCDLFMHVAQDKRYTIVGDETIHSVFNHLYKMYTNIPTTFMGSTPDELLTTLTNMIGILHNRYSGVATIDEAIHTLVDTNDLDDKLPYPIFETMIDSLIQNINSNSGVHNDLKALKLEVKHLWKLHSLRYTVYMVGYRANNTDNTIIDLISKLRAIQDMQEEKRNMHMTFDDVINPLTKGLTTTEQQYGAIYIPHALANLYHLKETYKNNTHVSQYLDYVDSKLTGLSMKNDESIPLNEFLSFIYIAKSTYDYLDVDNTHTNITGEFYTHDHIPTVKELNQQQATKSVQWVLEAKDELLNWFNQIVIHSASVADNEAVLDSYHYPKAYELMTIQPEYLTDKGYRLNSSLSSVSKDKDYIGSAFVDVPAFTVTWDRDIKLIKTILY